MISKQTKTTMSKTENKWRDSVLVPFFKKMGIVYFIKEAGTIRGLPDIVAVYRSTPIFLEVKRGKSCLTHPRTRLQEYQMKKLRDAGAKCWFIYPENAREVMKDLFILMLTEKKITEIEFSHALLVIVEAFPSSCPSLNELE